METRSKTRVAVTVREDRSLYFNSNEFDEAILAWNRNKKRIGQMYVYVCGKTTSVGKPCQKRPANGGCVCAQHKIK